MSRDAGRSSHRRDEREPSGELYGTDHPRNDDTAVLERMPKSFERVTAELSELVEEQHAVVGKGAGIYTAGVRADSSPRILRTALGWAPNAVLTCGNARR
jgi:hypothetical protein